MITQDQKKATCKDHSDLLQLIWLFGGGLMFKSHVERYMEHFSGKKPFDTWQAMRKLEQSGLIERIKFYNVILIKLRKYALCFLLNKERNQVSSVSANLAKIKKTAFINEIVLRDITDIQNKSKTRLPVEKFFLAYSKRTTFFCSAKKSHEVLSWYQANGLFIDFISSEIGDLQKIEQKNKSFLRNSPTMPSKNKKKEKNGGEDESRYNLNSMQSSGVHLKFTEKNSALVRIAIFDINSQLSADALALKMMNVFRYLNNYFSDGVQPQFSVYTVSKERKSALEKVRVSNLLEKHLQRDLNFGQIPFAWEVINLNLENILFGKQKILLSVKEKREPKRKI
jgi:hypothetical protein